MAYYTALSAAWALSSASPGALPPGVAGTSLYGLSTSAKIDAINKWTVTGTIPTRFFVSGAEIWNCLNYTEYLALTESQKADIRALCNCPGPLLSGSAVTGLVLPGTIIAGFIYSSSFTGSISGTALTVTTTPTKPLLPGAVLSGNGVAAGTTVVSGPANGGQGSYVVSISQTVASGTITQAQGPSLAAFQALASAQVQPWWQVSIANGGGGLSGVVTQADVTTAGLA